MELARPRVLVLATAILAACGGGDAPDGTRAHSGTPATAPATSAPVPTTAAAVPTVPAAEVRAESPGDPIAVSRGQSGFACALRRSGRVACWGRNDRGQLGQASSDPIDAAVEVVGLDDAIAIAAGLSTTCAVRTSGRVVCWGDARSGALGTDDRRTAHRGLVEVPGVSEADAIFAGTSRFCARTRGGDVVCWGIRDAAVEEGPRGSGPTRLTLRDVRELRLLGQRRFALHGGGGATWWGWDERSRSFGPEPVPGGDVVDAAGTSGAHCLARGSGEVRCWTSSGGAVEERVAESLRGARAIVFGPGTQITGLLADGTLATFPRYATGGDPSPLADARDLVAMAPGEGGVVAITRDGRVREWGHAAPRDGRWPSREIALPPTGSTAPTPELPEGPMRAFCGVRARAVALTDEGTLADVARGALGGEEPHDADALCASVGLATASPDCPRGGPYFARQARTGWISLLVPRAGDRFARVPELAMHSDGTEESSLVERYEVRSTSPLEAHFLVTESEQECLDDDGTDCGLGEVRRRQVVVLGTPDAEAIVVEVVIASESAPPIELSGLAAPRVRLDGGSIDVWACGGHERIARPTIVAPPAGAADVDSAAARCAEGWSRFGAGDRESAQLDVDAALVVLERATDDRGRRALGACLYNRGRIAEDAGDVARARTLYRRSLEARPNATVEARLTGLGG